MTTPIRYLLRIKSETSEASHTFRMACEHACLTSRMWGATVAVVRSERDRELRKTIVAYDCGQRSYYDWREVATAREAERASGEHAATPEYT